MNIVTNFLLSVLCKLTTGSDLEMTVGSNVPAWHKAILNKAHACSGV